MDKQILLDYNEYLALTMKELELAAINKNFNAAVLKNTEEFMKLLDTTAKKFPALTLDKAVGMLEKVRQVLYAPKKV